MDKRRVADKNAGAVTVRKKMKPSQQRTFDHLTAKIFGVIEAAHTSAEWDAFYEKAIQEHVAFASKYAAHYQDTGKQLPASRTEASHKAATARVAAYRALIPALAVALNGTVVEACEPSSPYAALAFKHREQGTGFLVHSATPGDHCWEWDTHSGTLRAIEAVIAAIVLGERWE